MRPPMLGNANFGSMSDIEDYPGPSHEHPEKRGQHPRGRADEEMVKPPAKPRPEDVKEKTQNDLAC
jgi:hypothetical protein